MKIVLSSRGSRGDVFPIVAIGAALQQRGHDVALCVPALFTDVARKQVRVARSYSEDSERIMTEFGSGWRALRPLLTWFTHTMEEQFEVLTELTAHADLLVSSTNELAAPSVAELRRIPFVRVTYGPMIAGYESNALIPWQGLPEIANRMAWSAINLGVESVTFHPINANRRRLGLPRLHRIGDYVARRGHNIFAMSRALAPPCRSWSGQYTYDYTGSCQGAQDGPLPVAVEEFLGAGPAPIYLGFGSVSVADPDRFTTMVLDAVRLAGCRAIVGAGWAGLGANGMLKDVLVVGDTPHAALFPRTAGVVHHGGSGTTHTVARAGVPQLVMPQIADQHYWGHRVQQLALGPAPLPAKKATAVSLARALCELTGDVTYGCAARRVAQRVAEDRGVAAAVEIIERQVEGAHVASVRAGGIGRAARVSPAA